MTTREGAPAEIKATLSAALQPTRISVTRTHDGAVSLRVLSERFLEGDPLETVQQVLAQAGLALPPRTLSILKAPSELEEGEEEALFNAETQELWRGTPNWSDALIVQPTSTFPDERRFGSTPIVVFWGVKGGVGRSTALGHIGAILSRRTSVLAIDLDLDSPSLVATHGRSRGSATQARFDDIVRSAASPGISDDDLTQMIKGAPEFGRRWSVT